ncbi:MAG: hypothetical protein HUU46_20300 [Candidatus Hydrogenedentes bacterium]|nr:hypothetical protein [Candidatus Hydrogenedentota bacterium]
MSSSVITNALTSILTAAVMLALYKMFPPRLQDYRLPPGTDMQALAQKYYKFEFGLNLLYILALVAWMAVAYWVFRAVGEFFASRLGEAEFTLTPLWFVWFFPAFPAAMFLAALVVEPLALRILGDRKAEYDAVQESRFGRLARMTARHFYIGCFLPSLAIAYLFVDTYVIFREGEIVIDPLTRLAARHYMYSDVERILAAPKSVAPNGNVGGEWRFVICFGDGGRWNSKWDPSGAGVAVHKRIAEFVSQKSDVEIETIEVLQRADQ